MTLAELIQAARELAPADRVALAHELMVSVDEDEDQAGVDAAWTAEIGSRVDDIVNGDVQTVRFGETYAKLSAKIAAARQ